MGRQYERNQKQPNDSFAVRAVRSQDWRKAEADRMGEDLRRSCEARGEPEGANSCEERWCVVGREIRRVPVDWEHPQDSRTGQYRPLVNRDFETEAREWLDNAIAWDKGEHPDLVNNHTTKEKHPFYWMWSDKPPDAEYYRPRFTSEPTAYQIYETVSEGTPVSPVFQTEEEIFTWLIQQGHSEKSARNFVKAEWAPSMIIQGGAITMGIDACELMGDNK
jgi:hypothetical protein